MIDHDDHDDPDNPDDPDDHDDHDDHEDHDHHDANRCSNKVQPDFLLSVCTSGASSVIFICEAPSITIDDLLTVSCQIERL